MRKAVIEVGDYTVREMPTGGWHIFVRGSELPVSRCEDQKQAVTLAKRYREQDRVGLSLSE